MSSADIHTLRTNQESEAVCEAALSIADGSDPEALSVLAEKLQREDFLSILDSEEDYQSPPHTLNITGVLEGLAENKASRAEELLVQLTQAPAFLNKLSRIEMLILACANLRPPPQPVLKFWIQQASPESSSTPLVVEALLTNGTESALKLFEGLINNPSYSESDKRFWLRMYAVPHRDDFYFIEAADRALRTDTADPLRFEWVRVIFDYRVGWYPPREMPTPPNAEQIQPQAMEKLLQVGNLALSLPELPEDLKPAIETRLKAYRETSN